MGEDIQLHLCDLRDEELQSARRAAIRQVLRDEDTRAVVQWDDAATGGARPGHSRESFGDAAAVEHETGLEPLFGAVGLPIASGALYDLLKWGAARRADRRKRLSQAGRVKAPGYLEIERSVRAPDGTLLSLSN